MESNINKLLNSCDLPINYSPTSHCFNDSTHHTCCILGPKAREYANNSGNPIGIASEKAFEKKFGYKPKKNDLTTWCTCFGSLVCSHYANKFNDGTRVKFINNPNSKNPQIINNIKSKDCEEFVRKELNIAKHGTPGIIPGYENDKKCLNFSILDNTKIL